MSDDDRTTIKDALVRRVLGEPMFTLTLALLGSSIVWLASTGKGTEFLPWIVGVGIFACGGIGLASICEWIASRLTILTEIATSLRELATDNRAMVRVMGSIVEALPGKRTTLLIVEDNAVERLKLRQMLTPVAAEFHLSVQAVSTMDEADALVWDARCAVVDVRYVDGVDDEIRAVNRLITFAGPRCKVIVNSHEEFPADTFCDAAAVIHKGSHVELATVVRNLLSESC
jgi:hypothetical protein